jgi:hypothetical protein
VLVSCILKMHPAHVIGLLVQGKDAIRCVIKFALLDAGIEDAKVHMENAN